MSEDTKDELLPPDPGGDYLDAAAMCTSIIPVLGGAISNVLNGWSLERRMQRVREVLEDLSAGIQGLNASQDQYVRSDEFEDLLDRTLRQVAAERHRDKRRLYAAFLAGAIANPGEPYHEQLRFLRTIDELQPDHMRIIRAMLQEAPEEESGRYRSMSGSILGTLQRRLPDIAGDRLAELALQLTDELRLVTIGPALNSMMTARGAEDLRSRFTPYGLRLVAYILAAEEEPK
jgi:hypothetical protein